MAQDMPTLTAALTGRVDTGNALQEEQRLMALRQQPHGAMVLDLKGLKYISSAGLRVILRLRKLEADLSLVNASPLVYDILETTGFTQMMPVEKAHRSISVEGCPAIGRGANGVVYRIAPDAVVKVYDRPDCLPQVRRERQLARKALVLGVPTAIPYDVVRVGERYGAVFEMLQAQSLSGLIAQSPQDLDRYVALYVELIQHIHAIRVQPGELPSMKALALQWVRDLKPHLAPEKGDKLEALVAAVPDRDTMLHGDCHTNNVMLQGEEALIIDLDTLCVGHPVFELASMHMAYVGFGELNPEAVNAFLRLPAATAQLIWRKSLEGYLGRGDEGANQVEAKAMVLGYARLMRRTLRRGGLDTPQGRAQVALCRERLDGLLEQVDSLDF